MYVLLLSGLVGCGGQPAPVVLDVRAAIGPYCDTPDVPTHGDGLVVFEGPSPTLAVHVELGESFRVDGKVIEPGGLAERLREKRVSALDLHRLTANDAMAFKGDLLLRMRPETPAETIVEVLRAAETEGYAQIQFLGRSAKRFVRPPYADPAFAARLEAASEEPAETSQKAIGAVRAGVMESCPPAEEVLQASIDAARAGQGNQCEAVVRGLTDALPKCAPADAAKILTLFQFRPKMGDYAVTALPIRLDPSGTVFEVRSSETWADLVPRLKSVGQGTRWVLVDG